MNLKSILVSASLLLLLGAGQGASEDQSAKGTGFSEETVSIIKQRLGIGNRKAGEEIYPDEYGLTQGQGKGKDQGQAQRAAPRPGEDANPAPRAFKITLAAKSGTSPWTPAVWHRAVSCRRSKRRPGGKGIGPGARHNCRQG